jgi:hypothetical protein
MSRKGDSSKRYFSLRGPSKEKGLHKSDFKRYFPNFFATTARTRTVPHPYRR